MGAGLLWVFLPIFRFIFRYLFLMFILAVFPQGGFREGQRLPPSVHSLVAIACLRLYSWFRFCCCCCCCCCCWCWCSCSRCCCGGCRCRWRSIHHRTTKLKRKTNKMPRHVKFDCHRLHTVLSALTTVL